MSRLWLLLSLLIAALAQPANAQDFSKYTPEALERELATSADALVDVAPDGTAWIIGDTIFRARYRQGFDKPVMMRPGEVYSIKPTTIATSMHFGKGHRIRIEVTSSNFPKFARNLNTGGPNERERKAVVAENSVHHGPGEHSYVDLPVVP